MGYFDAVSRSSFKTASDGRRLFFPWGTLGRGYIIESEQEFERLQRLVKAYLVGILVLIIAVQLLVSPLASFVAAALVLVPYLIWARRLMQRMPPSEERLSLKESMASQARAYSAASLWFLEICSLGFVCTGILMLLFDRNHRLSGLASIVFFGPCAAFFAVQLVQRKREARASP
jgi:hypothetical protein